MYISYVLFVCIRRYACVTCIHPYVVRTWSVCIRMSSVCYPYLSVFVRMLFVCIRMYPYVVRTLPCAVRMYPCVTHMLFVCYPYVFRMLSVCYLYVPLCIREALVCYSVYVTRFCPCVVLVKIGCLTEFTILKVLFKRCFHL